MSARILVVDDSPTQALKLQFILEEQDYEVTVARDGREALEVARRQPPALVISDIVMPVMDGCAMCHALKADPALRRIPVILLTTLADTKDIVQGLKAKADYYITKPYNETSLVARVKSILTSPTPHNGTRDDAAEMEAALEVVLADERHVIRASRQQMLNLLLSTYENAVEQNRELSRTQRELKTLNEQLQAQTRQIQEQQTKLQEANAQLQALAALDGLTGLFNHRAFKEKLEEELQRAVRYHLPLSLLLLDVDRFKQYNDTYGHPAGDEVLKMVARLLLQSPREIDFVARYGGEEFVVLLPNTDRAAALILAERLRLAIETAPWPQRAVTASFGATTLTPATANGAALIAEADEALYHSKETGRNRVTHADEMELERR